MAEFAIKGKKFDGAFCAVDSFRHLLSEKSALNHLKCVSKHLKTHGIYVMAFHLLPKTGFTEKLSRWTSRRGNSSLHTTISLVGINRRKREETLSVVFRIKNHHVHQKYTSSFKLRTYSREQILALLDEAGSFDIIGVFDHSYDLEAPTILTYKSEDVVLVLRKH